jgi:hypothetical protein
MKRGIFLVYLCVIAARAAEPVRVQLNSYSLLFHPAVVEIFGAEFVNQVSSMGHNATPNGELRLTADPFWTHEGTFHYQDGFTFERATFNFLMDIPDVDRNNNLTPDVLEFEQSLIGWQSYGVYRDDEDDHILFQCTWNKPANSHTGTCEMNAILGLKFTHTFELLEYKGEWTNAVVNASGEGTVNLRLGRSGVEEQFLEGPLNFTFRNQRMIVQTNSALKTETGANFVILNGNEVFLENRLAFAILFVLDGTPVIDPETFNYEDFQT